jgi:23S rRNA (uracil1939-C5)-methyltransferase
MSADPIHILYGKDHVTEDIGDLSFEIGFRSFFQTNTLQAENMFELIAQYADLTGREKIIDAYCGIGSIGLYLAQKAHKVFGIEWVRPAITDARINARKNNIKNAFFEVGNVDQVIRKWSKFKFDAIILDPPRKGVSKQTLKTVIRMGIPRIVYVSCDQATMGRDLRYLTHGGYEIREVTPVDMFPQTTQIESVSLLVKRSSSE